MKIHRDNTKVALTQEMKDEVFEREQEKIKEAERQLNAKIKKDEEAKKINEEIKDAQQEFADTVQPVGMRQMAYPPIAEQLDMLWHDMDNGIIKVDKRRKGTWYSIIKESKENTPVSKTWREDSTKAQIKIEEANQRMANNNLHGV
mgnify:CR=1 FL=1